MLNSNFKYFLRQSFPLQLLFFVGGALCYYFLVFILGYFIASSVFSPTVDNLNYLRLLQFVLSLLFFVGGAFLFAPVFFKSDSLFHQLSLSSSPAFLPALLAILAVVASIPFINFLGNWNASFFPPNSVTQLEMQLLASHSVWVFVANLVVLALVPAIGEELFFRGLLQNAFARHMNAQVAVWVVAFLFSAFHMQFDGFVPRLLLGAFLGYLLLWSHSVWLPALAHFINNGSIVVFAFFFPKGINGVQLDKVGLDSPLCLVLSILAISLCVYGLWRFRHSPTLYRSCK